MLTNFLSKNSIAQLALLTGVMAINYILYCTKDTLIVHHISPESIVFLRTYLVLPFIFLFFLVSNKLSSLFGLKQFFMVLVTAFVVFQVGFAFVLYPNLEFFKFSISETTLWLSPFYQLFVLWPLTLFYLVAEIWVVFVLGVIIWQAINTMNTVDSAKKNYHSLQFFSNVIIILTSQLILFINFTNAGDWCFSLKVKSLLLIPLGFLVVYSIFILLPSGNLKKTKKKSISILSTLKLIAKSQKGTALFFLILFYAFCNTFSETINRFYIKNYALDIISYNNVMAMQSLFISIFTIIFIILGKFLVRYNLQILSIVLTPMFVLTTTITVICLSVFYPQHAWLLMMVSVLQLSVIKSSKYGLIDPVKECCYLELDDEMKAQGKSFIDGISNRFGKTLGNFFQQFIFIAKGELSSSLLILMMFLAITSVFWIFNTVNSHHNRST